MLKRIFDLVLSLLLLIIAAPLMLFVSIVLPLTSPGPFLFRQVRAGRDFKPFRILKFRTMNHAEGGLAYTLGPDPRITPFGKWLRRTKIDELPQLWNIVLGEMSFVGPRPVVTELTEEFHEEYKLLLRNRPGLTDPASLKYSQEAGLFIGMKYPFEAYKLVVVPDKLRISALYMDAATPWTDLTTLLMTILICVFPTFSKVYGVVPFGCESGEAPREMRIEKLRQSMLAPWKVILGLYLVIQSTLRGVN